MSLKVELLAGLLLQDPREWDSPAHIPVAALRPPGPDNEMGAGQGRSREGGENGTGTQRLQFNVGDPQDEETTEDKEDEVARCTVWQSCCMKNMSYSRMVKMGLQ